MQFHTTLTGRIPCCSCNRCGVTAILVSFAEKLSRFTRLLETFAIDVLQAAQSTQAPSLLLRIALSTAFFESWYASAIPSGLDPIKKVAGIMKNRLGRILTWFSSPISK